MAKDDGALEEYKGEIEELASELVVDAVVPV